LFVCFTISCSDKSAKPVRIEVEIEESNKPRRKRINGDLLNLLYKTSKVRVV
jgi:hypothetical protein